MRNVQVLVILLLCCVVVSCRQAPQGNREVTVVDQSRSVVDVEYTVNGAGGGSFRFEPVEETEGEDRSRYRKLPALGAADVIELTPRMINGFSGTTSIDLGEYPNGEIFLIIDRNGDITVRDSIAVP